MFIEIGTVSIVGGNTVVPNAVVFVVGLLLAIVVTFDADVSAIYAICALGREIAVETITLCDEYVGSVSAKAELTVCTVLSAIAEFIETGAVTTDVECVSVKKCGPKVAVEASGKNVCKGTKYPEAVAVG